MPRILIIMTLVQCLCALCAQAVTLPFEQNYVEPFYAPKMQVVWAATNQLPASVRIFKVVPANFSRTAISNLTALGGTPNAKHGWMNYYQEPEMEDKLENVPDKARASELGTNVLARLEIPFDELEKQGGKLRAGFRPGWRGRFDKTSRQHITEPRSMGIEFRRLVDGLPCYGQYAEMQFESHERLTQLQVKWLGLKPIESHAVASSDQVVLWIKDGRARAHPVETTGSRWIKVADIKRVVIRNVQVVYDSGPDGGLFEKPPRYLYPYVVLDAELEFSPDDRESVGLSCPIIKEALTSPARKTTEFNILPKSFFEKQPRQEGGE